MAQKFFFGVELEFALGVSWTTEDEQLPFSAAGKKVRFLPSDFLRVKFSDEVKRRRTLPCIKQAILSELEGAGINASIEGKDGSWSIGHNGSVCGLSEDDDYSWFGIEVRTPVMEFNADSLAEIETVCKLLNDTFIVSTNPSTGLHVHISGGEEVIAFPTLQRLFCFLWAFESQLDTLHPEHRHNNEYTSSLRQSCALSETYYLREGIQPTVAQGVDNIKGAKTSLELCLMMFRADDDKYLSYNALPAKQFLEGEGGLPTIEFRQHEGTLDPNRVRNWVSLLIGIVEFCRDADSHSFEHLLIRATSREENEALYGEVPTELPAEDGGEVTIIDLLDYMGLDDIANYYIKNMFPGLGSIVGVNNITWSHGKIQGRMPQGGWKVMDVARKFWGALQHVAAVCKCVPNKALGSFNRRGDNQPDHLLTDGDEMTEPDDEELIPGNEWEIVD